MDPMSISQRTKGKVGEREFAQLLRDHGIAARRGVQYAGGPDSPDIVADLPFHFEVKRVEALNIHKAYAQACADAAPGRTPVVAFRRNHGPWLITLQAGEFLHLLSVAGLAPTKAGLSHPHPQQQKPATESLSETNNTNNGVQ